MTWTALITPGWKLLDAPNTRIRGDFRAPSETRFPRSWAPGGVWEFLFSHQESSPNSSNPFFNKNAFASTLNDVWLSELFIEIASMATGRTHVACRQILGTSVTYQNSRKHVKLWSLRSQSHPQEARSKFLTLQKTILPLLFRGVSKSFRRRQVYERSFRLPF